MSSIKRHFNRFGIPSSFCAHFAKVCVYSKNADLFLCPLPPALCGKDTKMKQKFHKTPKKQRGCYKYYNAKGELVVALYPERDSNISDIHIKLLHSLDDAEVYNNIKNCGSGSVEKKLGVEIQLDFHKSSRWVLSLNQLTDEDDKDYKENTRLIEQAYANNEAKSRDPGKEILYEAVNYLNPEQQELFYMYYIQEMTQPEIAKVLGISAPAVQKRRVKMREQLKEIIFKKILSRG